uniref:Class II aldolase/adducin N-terminal domain-containing protein n=1 Tax=Romanomermis culicivorax TaxID=13658 RepID=A0A915JDM5_ROMCU
MSVPVDRSTSYENGDSNHSEHPTILVPQLLKQFYNLGWVTGTGGGISVKFGDELYVAPSGVQKERIK